MAVAVLSALLSTVGGTPAPGLPALLGRVEVLTGWPMLGVAWAIAVGSLTAWAARLSAGLRGLSARNRERTLLLAAMLAPAVLPGASVFGLLPALGIAFMVAGRSENGADRRVALMLAAAVIGVLADPRVAPAGAVALVAAVRHLVAALGRGAVNDNTPPPFAWPVSGLA